MDPNAGDIVFATLALTEINNKVNNHFEPTKSINYDATAFSTVGLETQEAVVK